nr:putative protein [uncultured bacterium]
MTVDEAYSKLKKVSTQPANADDKAGFVISNKGYGQKAEGAPTISIYMEPLCPGCASVNRQLDQTLVKLMNAGQLNIDLHFLNFQDNKSSDNYSNRAFNGAIYIAEHDDDPHHLMSYLSNIYAEDFQPGELSNYEPVSNAKLEKQAVKAGVSEDVAAAALDPPHLGGIDHQQHNCIQFRGERHRAGARAFGARRQQCATVVGIDVNAPGVQARLQAGAGGAHAH